MPEAAEVEIVRLGLENILVSQGKTEINWIEILDPKLDIKNIDLNSFHQRVKSVRRAGKFLAIDFESGKSLEFHLRLAGRIVSGIDPKPRAILHWHDLGSKKNRHGVISFADARRFATMTLIDSDEFGKNVGIDLLTGNLDLWEPPKSKRAVKTVMLDQKFIAGIGNYLIDEALWREKVLPTKPFDKIKRTKAFDIAYTARSVAQAALKQGGMSIKDYVDIKSTEGNYQDSLKCYGRAGLPCVRCGKALSKTTVGGRGTTYCSYCQQ